MKKIIILFISILLFTMTTSHADIMNTVDKQFFKLMHELRKVDDPQAVPNNETVIESKKTIEQIYNKANYKQKKLIVSEFMSKLKNTKYQNIVMTTALLTIIPKNSKFPVLPLLDTAIPKFNNTSSNNIKLYNINCLSKSSWAIVSTVKELINSPDYKDKNCEVFNALYKTAKKSLSHAMLATNVYLKIIKNTHADPKNKKCDSSKDRTEHLNKLMAELPEDSSYSCMNKKKLLNTLGDTFTYKKNNIDSYGIDKIDLLNITIKTSSNSKNLSIYLTNFKTALIFDMTETEIPEKIEEILSNTNENNETYITGNRNGSKWYQKIFKKLVPENTISETGSTK